MNNNKLRFVFAALILGLSMQVWAEEEQDGSVVRQNWDRLPFVQRQ